MLPYGRQDVTQADIDAVLGVLRADFLTQGPAISKFEEAVASRVGAKHGVAVNSATSALHIAAMALDLGPGDLCWTVPNTFVASANCARYCGASIDFVDIDAQTWNISIAKLREKLETSKALGRLPKVVVPVHFSGQPTDQEQIWELAQEFGFRVIEDASHAIGATRRGEPVGSCKWSDITVFSFHPVKIITTGEGGMALTNDDEIARQLAMLRSHGITRDPAFYESAGPRGEDPWYYEQQLLGYNYRMTDIHAVLGSSQLDRLGEYVDRRNTIAKRYDEALSDLPLRLPTVREENRSAFHLYVVQLKSADLRSYRRRFAELRRRGVGVNLHYMPVHLQPYYRALGFHEGQFPEAEHHGLSALSLPMFPALTESQQGEVITAIRETL